MTDRPALAVPPVSGSLWSGITVVDSTGSTNADLVAAAGSGGVSGSVLVAEEQTAGRGRMGRGWTSPPRAALTFSVLLRPALRERRGWLPLLTGVAVARAVRAVAGLDARLKWPNDVLIGERKLAGILAEQSGDAVVIGIGVNVSTTAAELPAASGGSLAPTSLLLEGVVADRSVLLISVLDELERWYLAWQAAGNGLRDEYLALSATIGRAVRVELPGGRVLDGPASGLDVDGRLIVAGEPVAVGDVIHVRTAF